MKSLFGATTDIRTNSRAFMPDSYALVLVLFNCALEAHFLWVAKGTLAISVFLLLINFRFWFVSLLQIIIAMFWLATMFPRQPNHANVEFFVCILILSLFVCKLFKLQTHITPAVASWTFRVVTVCMYFYSGFHKLNTDFFDLSVSCVNEYWTAPMARVLRTLGCDNCAPRLTGLPFPLLTVLLEMVVPFGLFWPKTRKPVILLLLAFHAYLGIHGLINFSALAVFLLVGSAIDFGEALSSRTIMFLRIYILGILANALFHLGGSFKLPGFHDWQVITVISTVAFGIGAFWFMAGFLKENKTPEYRLQARHVPVLVAICCCVTAWALKSYVGLGTTGNFSMFSNLVTEKSRSNHFLIDTRHTKIWDFEENCVRIVALESHSKWQKYNADVMLRSKIPVTEFSYLIRKWSREYAGKIPCTLIYEGEKIQIENLKTSRFSEYHWWYKYLPFRIIQIDGANECRW